MLDRIYYYDDDQKLYDPNVQQELNDFAHENEDVRRGMASSYGPDFYAGGVFAAFAAETNQRIIDEGFMSG